MESVLLKRHVHRSPLAGRAVKIWAVREQSGMGQDSAFLTSSQVLLMLLVLRPQGVMRGFVVRIQTLSQKKGLMAENLQGALTLWLPRILLSFPSSKPHVSSYFNFSEIGMWKSYQKILQLLSRQASCDIWVVIWARVKSVVVRACSSICPLRSLPW